MDDSATIADDTIIINSTVHVAMNRITRINNCLGEYKNIIQFFNGVTIILSSTVSIIAALHDTVYGKIIKVNKTDGITAIFVIYNDIVIHTQREYYYIYGKSFDLVVLLTKDSDRQSVVN